MKWLWSPKRRGGALSIDLVTKAWRAPNEGQQPDDGRLREWTSGCRWHFHPRTDLVKENRADDDGRSTAP